MKIFKSKIIAVVLTLAMVLSVLAVPVAAAEVPATPAPAQVQPATAQEAADFLAAKDLLQGDNGDLMLDKELTREQMVVILSRLMGEEETAISYPTDNLTFTDVPLEDEYAPYIAWAQDTGITQGYDEETFGFGDSLTAWQTKAFFVRALGYTETADEEIIAKADELKVSTGSTVADQTAITRADMALLMSNTVYATNAEGTRLGETIGVLEPEVVVPPVVVPVVPTATVTADTVKSFKAVFSAAVDTTKATFEVKKDTIKLNVASIAWNEAKTEASLKMAANLTEGDYVVTINGLDLATPSTTITIKDEEVGKIVFTSDKAILDGTDAYVYYKVYNQYNQDITDDATLTFTVASATATPDATVDGKLNIDGTGAYEVDDKITVTAINAETGAFATQTFAVVAAAGADVVEIVKLYNADEKAVLEVGANPADFKLLLKVKDQYGNEMKDADAVEAGLIASVSNTSVVSVAKLGDVPTLGTLKLDDVDYLTLALAGITDDGKSTVRLISKTTGKTVSYEITILEVANADSITLTAPEIAVAGEDVDFAVSAVDQYGKPATKLAAFANADITLSGVTGLTNTDADFVLDGGKVVLRVDATALTGAAKLTEDKNLVINVITNTNKVISKTIKLKKNAVPTVITGLKDATTSFAVAGTEDIELDNVVIEDQYGRVMDKEDLPAGYVVKFATSDVAKVTVGATLDQTPGAKVTLAGVAKGSSTITAKLNDGAADVTNSEYEFTSKVVERADIDTYTVDEINKVYATGLVQNTDYSVDVVVKGKTSSGLEVVVPNDGNYYSVSLVTDQPSFVKYLNGEVYALANDGSTDIDVDSDTKEDSAAVVVTIIANGQTITKPIVVTTKKPEIAKVELDTENAAYVNATTVKLASTVDTQGEVETAIRGALLYTDNYGNENYTPAIASQVIVTNLPEDKVLDNIVAGETYDVVVVTENGKLMTIKVNVE